MHKIGRSVVEPMSDFKAGLMQPGNRCLTKLVRPSIPRDGGWREHLEIIWSGVCSSASHSHATVRGGQYRVLKYRVLYHGTFLVSVLSVLGTAVLCLPTVLFL